MVTRAGARNAFGESLPWLLGLAAMMCAVGWTGCRVADAARAAPAAGHDDSLVLVHRVEHLGTLAREPMIVQHPDRTLVVAGYPIERPARPQLWTSRDQGQTWSRVHVDTASPDAIGNSDVDLAVGPKGTVYAVEMDFDVKTGEGRGIAVGVSSDAGATWAWTTLSRMRFDDRPWVAVAPDGTAHVIWNDGQGVAHAVSTDRGRTWKQLGRVHDRGGSSHLAVGPGGDVAVRIGPVSASGNRDDPGIDLVAVSTDGGRTWRDRAPPRRQAWAAGFGPDTIPRWVEPLAWDARGGLYDLWTDSAGVWLSRSMDLGATWKSWRIGRPVAPRLAFYPYLVIDSTGKLAATWFTARLGSATAQPPWSSSPIRIVRYERLRWRVALITPGAGGAEPTVTASRPMPIDAWFPLLAHGDTVRVPDTGGEYLGLTFLRAGGVAVVTPVQDRAAHRMGFTFWRFEASPSSSAGARGGPSPSTVP